MVLLDGVKKLPALRERKSIRSDPSCQSIAPNTPRERHASRTRRRRIACFALPRRTIAPLRARASTFALFVPPVIKVTPHFGMPPKAPAGGKLIFNARHGGCRQSSARRLRTLSTGRNSRYTS